MEERAVTYRPMGAFFTLSVFTLGLYWLYLLYSWAGDINRLYGSPHYSPRWVVLTTLLTLGLAGFWYHWRFARELLLIGTIASASGDSSPAPSHELPSRVAIGLGLSVLISLFSGGLALFLSIAVLLWAAWQVQAALNTMVKPDLARI